ncbi:hypothetical protein U1Q18_048043, partial [Sarracenia purpurea var. burkii]
SICPKDSNSATVQNGVSAFWSVSPICGCEVGDHFESVWTWDQKGILRHRSAESLGLAEGRK